eukprot:gene6698-8285_t
MNNNGNINQLFFKESISVSNQLKAFTLGGDENGSLPDYEITANVESITFSIYTDQQYREFFYGSQHKRMPLSLKSLIINISDDISGSGVIDPIPVGFLPMTLERLIIVGDGNTRMLQKGSIPDSVQYLKLSHLFFKHDPLNLIPCGVTELVIDEMDSDSLSLPVTVSHLHSDSHKLSNFASMKLKKLDFTRLHIGHPVQVGMLPQTLEYLNFGFSFKQTIEMGALPHGLKHLKLGSYNYPLAKGLLPSTLTYLVLGSSFENDCMYFPPSLLGLECFFKEIRIGQLPENLEVLLLYSDVKSIEPGSLPKTLSEIEFHRSFNFKVKDIQKEIFDSFASCPSLIRMYSTIDSIPNGFKFPQSIKHLKLPSYFKSPLPLGVLPSRLESLEIGGGILFKEPNDIHLPPTLTSLFIRENYWDPNHLPTINSIPYLNSHFKEVITEFILSTNRNIRVNYFNTVILQTMDQSDQYLYYSSLNGFSDGFIRKSNISTFIDKFLLFHKHL